MVEKSPFQIMKESDPKERLDHLIKLSLKEDYEMRREDYEYSGNSKRKRILNSLGVSGDEFENEILWDMTFCKSYNVKRLQPLLREVGPRWRRKIKGMKLDPSLSKTFTSFRDEKGKVSKKSLEKYLKTTSTKKVCQSLWCPNCRKVVTELYKHKIQSHLDRKTWRDSFFEKKEDYQNSHLLHITGTVGLSKFDEGDLDKILKKDTNTWKRIRRRLNRSDIIDPFYDPWIECVYEFELVNWKFLKNSEGSPNKVKEITQLRERDGITDNLFLYVHFHGITNLTRKQINAVFLDEYWLNSDEKIFGKDDKSGLYIQSLHSNKTLQQNIEKIGSYPFKDAIRFKHSFIGSDYSNGEYMNALELNQLISVYHKVQGRSWRSLFRSCHNDMLMTMEKYKEAFDDNHNVWNFITRPFALVDGFGNVYVDPKEDPRSLTYGYNPDSHPAVEGVLVSERKIDRKPVGREYFYHPDFYPELKVRVYRNVYDESSYDISEEEKIISLWEYYQDSKDIGENLEDAYEKSLWLHVEHGKIVTTTPSSFKQFLGRNYWDAKKRSRHIVGYDKDRVPIIIPKGFLDDDTLFIEIKNYNDFLKHLTPSQRKKLSLRRFMEKVRKYDLVEVEKIITPFEKSKTDSDKRNQLFEFMNDWGIEDEDIDLIDWND